MLAALYNKFPKPCALLPGDFIEGGKAAVLDPDEFTGAGLMPDAEFFMDTVSWLEMSGFIAIKDRGQHYFSQCVLTAKGLVALNAFPASLQGDKSYGEQMRDAAKKGAKSVLSALTKEVISSAVGAAFTAITK
ncbi:hypothetical protein PCA31118_04837 [Pandoraea captiosa]|uniref:Uncharacterized protein n=1 Tax=Pandoraea captiosa TaxID=2508302 RepID=A0A5E5ARN8_9BURK|nr:hypothetical protein PCA31118_04837 [Pandoraea captiosa]